MRSQDNQPTQLIGCAEILKINAQVVEQRLKLLLRDITSVIGGDCDLHFRKLSCLICIDGTSRFAGAANNKDSNAFAALPLDVRQGFALPAPIS